MHILIFELILEGHHSVYLEEIAKAYLEKEFLVTITVLEEFENHPKLRKLKDIFDHNLNITVLNKKKSDSIIRFLGGNIGGEFMNWLLFRKKYLEINKNKKIDYIFFPCLDYCFNIIGLIGPPSYQKKWGGICIQTSFHEVEYKFIKPPEKFEIVKKILFRRVLNCKSLEKLFTIDELLIKYTKNKHSSVSDRVEYLADPAELKGDHTCVSARNVLNIPISARVILVYGSISPRKGLDVLVAALSNAGVDKSLHILIVGKQEKSMAAFFETSEINELYKNGRIHIVNDFVNPTIEQMAFSAADIVWLGYHNHYAMSSVLVLAGKAKKVTIATNDGLIGWHTRQKRLGLTVNVKSNFEVRAALNYLSNPIRLKCLQEKIMPSFENNTWEYATKSILNSTPSISDL